MSNENRPEIILSPYVPADLSSTLIYAAPEGGHRPIGGKFPLYPFIYSDWEKEELSWYDNCYIHAALNPFIFQLFFKGKDFLKLLTDYTVNTYTNFPVGKARHVIRCNDDGKIITDGIVVRRGEDEFLSMCVFGLDAIADANKSKYDLTWEDQSDKRFFYQLCGPRSLEIVEAAAQEDLHDIKMMYARDAKIAGKDVFILRTSMAGTLGYEVHGMIEDTLAVYNKLLEVGKEYGITEIGRHAYRNTHAEGSIPQGGLHFGFPANAVPNVYGSLDPNSELVFRSPFDVGWGGLVKFNHEFPGKAALWAEKNRHHNTGVHLIWNKEDILKVIATYFEPGNSCDIMDMVEDCNYILRRWDMRIDKVLDGDKLIGAVSGRMLSPKTREMISIATIDEDYAVEGKEVEILWGSPGTRQMRIRAKVVLYPYIKEGRNDNFDVETIPHRFPKKK
jgi:glycine cleavage system aminomethyltransferase T